MTRRVALKLRKIQPLNTYIYYPAETEIRDTSPGPLEIPIGCYSRQAPELGALSNTIARPPKPRIAPSISRAVIEFDACAQRQIKPCQGTVTRRLHAALKSSDRHPKPSPSYPSGSMDVVNQQNQSGELYTGKVIS